MKIIFVDAENVGFKGLEAIKSNIIDKVFVFSRVESIQSYSEQKLFLCLSDYPEGANQADFYIIAYLARVLASISKVGKNAIYFTLYSNDVNLINAFKFQCELLGAKSQIVSFKQENNAANVVCEISKSPKSETIKKQVFNMLNQPIGLFEIQTSLKLSKPIFSKAVNELVKDNKIKRVSKSSKNWV
ncbi:MAG: hypothetical protein ACJAS1_006987 [Oleiphilaceae bacterium]|jgi:hypothetical protein